MFNTHGFRFDDVTLYIGEGVGVGMARLVLGGVAKKGRKHATDVQGNTMHLHPYFTLCSY